jgi:biopolymer transport protein ExbB/TolQ
VADQQQPRVAPLDPPMVPFAVGGIVVWALIGLVVLAFFRDGRENWLWTCLAGFVLGFPGLAVMIRHDANRRRRLAAAQSSTDSTSPSS